MTDEYKYEREISFLINSPPLFNYKLAKDSSISFNQNQRPNWFHRTMQRWLLGIYWSVNK